MNIKTQIKILLDESFGSDGLVDADRVNAICDYIQQTFPDDKKISALKRYLRALLPELSRENVLIETSGKIDSETLAQLKNFAYRQTSRKNLRFNEKNRRIPFGRRENNLRGHNMGSFRSGRVEINTLR